MTEKDPSLQKKLDEDREAVKTNVKALAEYVFAQYSHKTDDYTKLFEYARRHKDTFKVKDDQVQYFKIFYNAWIEGKSVLLDDPNDNVIASTIGHIEPSFVSKGQIEISKEDERSVQLIDAIHESSKVDHITALQYFNMYNDISPMLTNAYFNPASGQYQMNINNYVDPTLVALFGPKIQDLEKRFLLSNMSTILHDKVHKPVQLFRSIADMELFFAMTSSRNTHLICDNTSVWKDLSKRCLIQQQLRSIVNNMRQGQIYDPRNNLFLESLNTCRMNREEVPFLLNRDPSAIMRRIFSALSYAPNYLTTITPLPQAGIVPAMTAQQEIFQVPMINVFLPQSFLQSNTTTAQNISLLDGVTNGSKQLLFANGMMVQRDVKIAHTDQVLIFDVRRRENYSMNALNGRLNMSPLTITGIVQPVLNDTNVSIPYVIRSDTIISNRIVRNAEESGHYYLRSAIIETYNNVRHFSQTKTVLFKWPEDIDGALMPSEVYLYDPINSVVNNYVNKPVSGTSGVPMDGPFVKLVANSSNTDFSAPSDGTGLNHTLSTQGTIFIYARRVKNPLTGKFEF